jgi:predicted Rossmann fold flavoprotein
MPRTGRDCDFLRKSDLSERIDTLILGGGAAGLFCAARAGDRGQSVLVIDHAKRPAEKVRISGGGRCNFTNIETGPTNFISANPHFAKSALARYTPWDFCDRVAQHGLTWHEKTLGQLFCDQKSGAIIKMLIDDLDAVGGQLRLSTGIGEVTRRDGRFIVSAGGKDISAGNLVIATGGLSIPKMGATSLAYDLARHFGHEVVATRPALVPFTFSGALKEAFSDLSGVSCPVDAKADTGPAFHESMLFTHRGLSGPAMLQVSSFWHESEPLDIDLAPGATLMEALAEARTQHPRQTFSTWLSGHFPARLAQYISGWPGMPASKQLAQLSKSEMDGVAAALRHWRPVPTGTEGYRTAEVTAGGVDTDGISSKTMESKSVPGLYFIGECVDVTGWLGGYNFQWAWASAAACAAALETR